MKTEGLTAIIVDDEQASIETLQKDLQFFPEIEVLETFTYPEKAARGIIRLQPDILFLDVQMPGLSGVELLRQIQEEIHTDMRVIFYTAYDEYLLDALRASAFDFLLKPYQPKELAFIIERIHTSASKQPGNLEQSLRKLLAQDNKFAIQTISGLMLVKWDDILLFKFLGEQRCWQMELTDRHKYKLRMSTTAKSLLTITPSFIQISQDCIVNLNYLASIENQTLKCDFYPPFSDVEEVVSHRYYRKLKDMLKIL